MKNSASTFRVLNASECPTLPADRSGCKKRKFGTTCPEALSIRSVLAPTELEKNCVDVSRSGCTGLHYVTCRSHRMQKQKFNVTCPITIFVESVSVPPEHYKLCVDISHHGRTGVHYVTRRSHRRQKQKFSVTCPNALFVKSVLVPPELKK
jgi:uncharacterized membrane protein YsdA (DUF1294 family)